jgi:HSP20 family protein
MAVRDPFREMELLRREVERAFDVHDNERRMDFRRGEFLPGHAARQYPLVNLYEDKDSFFVEALSPGVDPGSLNLTVQGNTLTISGEKPAGAKVAAEAYHRCERSAGKFIRTVELPAAIEGANVKAQYDNGLLLVTVPKQEEAKPKQITVKVGS